MDNKIEVLKRENFEVNAKGTIKNFKSRASSY